MFHLDAVAQQTPLTWNIAANDEALLRNVMVWSFVGAGVALAATAVVFFVIKPPAKPKVEGAVGFGPGGPSLLLRGEF